MKIIRFPHMIRDEKLLQALSEIWLEYMIENETTIQKRYHVKNSNGEVNITINKIKNVIKNLADSNSGVTILLQKEKIIGFITYHIISKVTAIITNIYIKKDFRGRGYGTVLLKDMEEYLMLKGIKELRLYAISDSSIHFFKKHNYVLSSTGEIMTKSMI
ncbi:MAG: GNAT family N-acetyltransferase [Candidatus Odinarchaeota archaeon]|nr:GNAT family N-acetyltransferase [Candidatus Odinarchaeota archaeon]